MHVFHSSSNVVDHFKGRAAVCGVLSMMPLLLASRWLFWGEPNSFCLGLGLPFVAGLTNHHPATRIPCRTG